MEQGIELSKYWCPRKECKDYGKTGKGSIRGLARATNHSQTTIRNWIKVAGDHCRDVNEYYLNELKLERAQVDEIWSYKKQRNLRDSDPLDYGDIDFFQVWYNFVKPHKSLRL